ncbi:hypothetical protein D9757_004657 [Collybiopsis confluens]|uniref:5-hydroxyisourate hydrolase n=1 Tax=Collybiopsis confluens TaxID=2823264 RepID=A0A8H5MCE9_9AGAR|nr:hypothetical protein D9757_004657 [Collybiopsis confluens]
MAISPITCHVLDTSTGRPAEGVVIKLQQHEPRSDGSFLFNPLAQSITNSDGRCTDLLSPALVAGTLNPGLYKIIFRTKEYFESKSVQSFYPWVEITFELSNPSEHYHIPLLISPYGFSTYRGS